MSAPAPAPKARADRVAGGTYLYKDELRVWTGKIWHCRHDRFIPHCAECGGSSKCVEHGTLKTVCKKCGGSNLCKLHGKQKHQCPVCSPKCDHGNLPRRCKECGGEDLCKPHKRRKEYCRPCGGSALCDHNLQPQTCRYCDGSQLCQLCKMTLQTAKYKPYCAGCYYHLNPDVPVSRLFKTKERHLHEELKQAFRDQVFVYDKRVEGGCSARRPDFRWECGTHSVIVECDENQHSSDSYECENRRTMEIWQDLGDRPLVLIRFNPDGYVDESGKRVRSCFTKEGKVVEGEWSKRFAVLKAEVAKWLKQVPEKEAATQVNLFYSALDLADAMGSLSL